MTSRPTFLLLAVVAAAAAGGLACTADPLQGPIDAGPRTHPNPDNWVLGPDCAKCTIAPIGFAPLWQPARVVLFSGNVGASAEHATSFFQSVLEPRHQFLTASRMFVSAEKHAPPYDDEIYEMLDARGITPRQAFDDVQFTAPQAVTMMMAVVPGPQAPAAPTIDFDAGPAIPQPTFPISIELSLYRNGAVFAPASNQSLSGFGGPGLSHLFVGFVASGALGGAPGLPPDGAYEYRLAMTDARGSGWNVTVPFTVGKGRTPTTPSAGVTLTPDATGFLDGSNPAGVRGSWWATGDAYGTDGSAGGGACPMAGFPPIACSIIMTPTPGQPWIPSGEGRMCTAGVVAPVALGSDGAPAWSAIWGTLAGFNLAETPGPPGEPAIAGPYDAVAHGFTGFAFDIDRPPAGGRIRVNVATPATNNNAAYWMGATADVSPVAMPAHYEVRWSEVGGPMYLGPTAPAFEPRQISSITWQVVANPSGPVPYSFCISNVALLRD